MKIATMTIEGVSPYSQSKAYSVLRLDRESDRDYEARTWRERMHYDEAGQVFIPPMAIKNCLTDCAMFLGEKIAGKGRQTWTKHFLAGIMCIEPIMIGVNKTDVAGQWLFVPSDGKRGGAKRVWKCFPMIPEWKGIAIVHILDGTITEGPFRHHAEEAGKFIGLGYFRPRNGGYWGRFGVNKVEWE